jgi:hypothetical protein
MIFFFRSSLVGLDIYFEDFSLHHTKQSVAYPLSSFFSEPQCVSLELRLKLNSAGDVGGFLGLLLGASIISLVEIIDYIILGMLHNRKRPCMKPKEPDPVML